MKGSAARLLLSAAALMFLSGCFFAFTRLWIQAALSWAGAFGCAAAALNFKQ